MVNNFKICKNCSLKIAPIPFWFANLNLELLLNIKWRHGKRHNAVHFEEPLLQKLNRQKEWKWLVKHSNDNIVSVWFWSLRTILVFPENTASVLNDVSQVCFLPRFVRLLSKRKDYLMANIKFCSNLKLYYNKRVQL